jgi:hypothetical protein
MTDHLYRVHITAYPEGSVEPIYDGESEEPDCWVPVPGWAPPGWKPEGNYVKMLGTTEFVWLTTTKLYRSRSTASKRAQLLESVGATVVIERSSRIVWPEHSHGEDLEPVIVGRHKHHVGKVHPEGHESVDVDESPMDRLRRHLASHQ